MNDADDVLDKLAADNPGFQVMAEDGVAGDTLLRLLTAQSEPLLTVKEPPAGWPVTVTQHHAEAGVTTGFSRCGEGHCPNTPHPDAVGEDQAFTRAGFARIDKQKACTPIDTPEKLLKLCQELLGRPEAKAICAKGERTAKRAGRMKGPAVAKSDGGPAPDSASPPHKLLRPPVTRDAEGNKITEPAAAPPPPGRVT